MNQREHLAMIRRALADPDLSQAINERLHDAAAELGIDILDPSETQKLQIVDRAIENCPE